MKRILTLMSELIIMLLAGKTEAGSAEVQLAGDSQLGVTDYRMGGRFQTGHPANFLAIVIQNSLIPEKTSLPKVRQSCFDLSQDRLNYEVDLSNSLG